MLHASRISAYAHSVQAAVAAGKTASPQAQRLGLAQRLAVTALEASHEAHIASGYTRAGRSVIMRPESTASTTPEAAAFGYLYAHSTYCAQGGPVIAKTPPGKRGALAPQLMLRCSGRISGSTSQSQFAHMFDGLALGFEVTSKPFRGDGYAIEDAICGNGFVLESIVGEMKGLSRHSRHNFSEVLAHSVISISNVNASGSQLRSFCQGSRLYSVLIDQIYSQSVTYLNEFGSSPLREGDYLALPIPGRSFAVAVSDVWVCVATGLQLEELRVTFVQ